MASDKQERKKRERERHDRIRAEVRNNIATAKNHLKYEEMRFAAYWLCSMLTLWIKMPKEKSNMDAVDAFAWRMCSGNKKEQEKDAIETRQPPPSYL
jgi:hypothetical protein